MNRTRRTWIEAITNSNPTHFITLTYNPFHRRTPKSKQAATENLGLLLHYLNKKLFGKRYKNRGMGLEGTGALELTERGVPHFHLLPVNADEIINRLMDSLRAVSKRFKEFNWTPRMYEDDPSAGFDIQEVYDPEGVADYITKSIRTETDTTVFYFNHKGVAI